MTVDMQQRVKIQNNAKDQSFAVQHAQKLVALLVWALVIGAFFVYTSVNQIELAQIPRLLERIISVPLFFIAFYALRPILFFPASILTVAGGAIFGPIGILYVVIGSNTSAMVAYLIGRFFGKNLLDEQADGVIQRYAKRMRDNSFETILIMRFVYIPYDLVNYLGGLLNINWKAFILATAIGSIPGTIFFTLAGASFENLDKALSGKLPDLNPVVLGISITMFIVSLLLSRYFKRREANRSATG